MLSVVRSIVKTGFTARRGIATTINSSSTTGLLSLPCSFYRGGTSKGLLWSTSTLSDFPHKTRDRIICHVMGSPDPDKRQIDGLGGGISSLSKTAIIGPPDQQLSLRMKRNGFDFRDGIDWIDDETLSNDSENGWDVVYRFGQVPITHDDDNGIDWTSTCGNLVSAVALFALDTKIINESQLERYFENKHGRGSKPLDQMSFPVRILVASSGQIIRAHVPLSISDETNGWVPDIHGETIISGVPGSAPGILIETPLVSKNILPTGNQIDQLQVEGITYPITIINAGLPTIFLPSSSLSSVLDVCLFPTLSPSQLDSNLPLMELIEKIRIASCRLTPFLQKTLSPSAPKVCILHPTPKDGYTTTSGQSIQSKDIDLLIRAISVGNFHRTVPATCLSALACARAFPDSTIQQTILASSSSHRPVADADPHIKSITVGQPAGLSSASVQVRPANPQEQSSGLSLVPESIIYLRTARRLIQGTVDISYSLVHS